MGRELIASWGSLLSAENICNLPGRNHSLTVESSTTIIAVEYF